jgi:uncharacterized membrane protein YsdA (DUF1294 family)
MFFMKLLPLYLLTVNAAAFLLMLIDKQKAKKDKWRIPEATLMGFAVFGGSIGAWLGMQIFRHKTRHKKFVLGIPFIIGVQVMICVFYWYYFL